ncbi:unnamed protein product [Lactuca virosa]|uniref:Pectinesterase inhibitor domain-containing protein n=1 Tax=Lactuca virosa TaxID=75947 RepID=A0AAU9LDC8_9ASTR|nr:unnamed protein product [Lactuca virosa]
MASLSLTKILILFLFTLLFSISNADSSPPYKLVDKVCSKLQDVDFCWQILQCDIRSKFAENITILSTIAFDVTIKQVNSSRDLLRGLKTGSPGVLKSLKDCIHAYSHVMSNLKLSKSKEDCSFISYHIQAAVEEIKRCQRIVDSNGAHGSFITNDNDVNEEACWLCESLANLMCKS